MNLIITKVLIHQRLYRVYYFCGLTLIIGICFMITLHFNNTHKSKIVRVSCHISRSNDALPLLRNDATLPEKSIFFHETSCKGGLTSRQACAVESAARTHPGHQINVLFTSPVSQERLDDSRLKTLTDHYKNVKLARVHIEDYADGTPLENPVHKLLRNANYVHISIIMKHLTMYKYSGIYLGFDAIVARPFNELWKNWAIRETPAALSSEIFSFSKNKVGRKLAQLAVGFLISELSEIKERLWSYNGPNILPSVFESWCTTPEIQRMSLSKCEDVAVYGPELFYPISFYDRQNYFRTALPDWKDQRIYTYFVWHRFTQYNLISKASLYWKIANEHCPMIASLYKNKVVGLIFP